MNKLYIILAIVVFFFILGLGLGGYIGYRESKITKDTIYKKIEIPVIEVDTLYATRIKTRTEIVEKWDTLTIKKIDSFYVSKAFEAIVDTVVKLDTIKFKYKFPENIFTEFQVKANPIYIPQVQSYEIKRAWYVDILTHISAFGLGLGTGAVLWK